MKTESLHSSDCAPGKHFIEDTGLQDGTRYCLVKKAQDMEGLRGLGIHTQAQPIFPDEKAVCDGNPVASLDSAITWVIRPVLPTAWRTMATVCVVTAPTAISVGM